MPVQVLLTQSWSSASHRTGVVVPRLMVLMSLGLWVASEWHMAQQGLKAAAAFAGAGCNICCACHGQQKHLNRNSGISDKPIIS